ncbi:MAG TPA: LPS assembly protein LptD [Ferrovibrio sp.]|uniref:LPS-assembly protein LptD n=1 Tax=Ferrovibrio sp. TaxID=1917215 RepID=UPI002ED27205
MSRRCSSFILLVFWSWLAISVSAFAQPSTNAPVLVTADTLKYDQSLGIVTAEGHVELAQNGETLLADLVSYSERDDKVVASGNVALMQQDGAVLFADYMELTGGMRNGFIRDASFLLADNSRGAAAYGERKDGNRTILHKGVYTTCSLCAKDPTRPPLWQLKADRVEHDQEAQEVYYRDATFEMFGVPILYTPYFSHPDPTVSRRSGLLPPSYLTNTYFGQAVRIPYYYVIDDNADLTLMPQFSTDQGGQIYGEFRQRRQTGEIDLDGSITKVDKSGNQQDGGEFRGHIRANMAFRANDDLTWGANIFRASDDTYPSLYRIPDYTTRNALTSRVYAEAINNRHYAAINAFAFQNIRTDVAPDTVPIVAPILDYSASTDPGKYGGYWTFGANMASIYREAGTDTRRLSTSATWTQPYYAPSGEIYTATAMLRADGYWVNDLNQSLGLQTDSNGSEFAGRVVPLVALDWRYPFVRDEGTVRQLIEPIVSAVITPYGSNSSRIPNEDSLSPEFDETNLFGLDRFPGYDRWDGGPRLNYGVRAAVYGQSGGYSELLVGQSIRGHADDTFAPGSGLDDQMSDYVGRLTISPGRYLSLIDRVRLSPNSKLAVRRNELTTQIGSNTSFLSITYADVADTDFLDDVGDQEAIAGTLRMQMTKYWSTEFRHTRDLGDRGGSLLNFAGLRYTDECFDIVVFAQRTFTVNREVQPDTTIGLRFRIATFN